VWNTVDKMAKKRAYVDAALSVTGATAIFTQDIGADPTESGPPAGPTHGPVVPAELKAQAAEAAIRICGRDRDRARAMWERIQAAFDGYMPHAAATALVHAAAELAAAENTTRDRRPAARPTPDSADDARGPTPAPPQSGVTADGRAREAALERSPHGPRLRAAASTRGIADGELANLIRVAAGAARTAPAQAAAQLETLLSRIKEPIAQQTLELIEMLHPASEQRTPVTGAGDAVSVDFGSIEPTDGEAA
jgi:hypothetical protein